MDERAIQDQFGFPNYCFGCGSENPDGLHIKSFWDGDEVVCRYLPRPAFMAGPTSVVNGGILATLIDCHAMTAAIAAAYRRENRAIGSDPLIWIVTASLRLDYKKPTPIAAPVVLRARIVGHEGRRTTVAVTLTSGDVDCVRGEVVGVRVAEGWQGK